MSKFLNLMLKFNCHIPLQCLVGFIMLSSCAYIRMYICDTLILIRTYKMLCLYGLVHIAVSSAEIKGTGSLFISLVSY
jgi:hypothetical protein